MPIISGGSLQVPAGQAKSWAQMARLQLRIWQKRNSLPGRCLPECHVGGAFRLVPGVLALPLPAVARTNTNCPWNRIQQICHRLACNQLAQRGRTEPTARAYASMRAPKAASKKNPTRRSRRFFFAGPGKPRPPLRRVSRERGELHLLSRTSPSCTPTRRAVRKRPNSSSGCLESMLMKK